MSIEAPVVSQNQAAPADSGPVLCPRCQKPLIDPSGLGWCKACGYCRTLEAERDNALLQSRPESSRGAVLTGVAGAIPVWFWLLILGIAAQAVLSLVVGRFLPPGNNFARALWTSVQIPIGLLIIFGAQFYAVVRIAPEDERLSFKDALVPTRLWALVAKRLPHMAGCVCLASWGASLALSAVLFIGGLKHWFSYLPGAEKTQPPAAQTPRR